MAITKFLKDGDRPKVETLLAEACEPVTRGQLLSLRNGSNLKTECHYVVTDYNRSNVGAAEILLHAVNENTLSMSAHIATTHDNVAWEGTYNVDTNRIESLHDNIGNDVYGEGSVDAFPWGVAAVSENEVREGRLDYTAGTVTENYIGSTARMTVSGGNVAQNTIEHSANVTINGGVFQDNTVRNDANVTISSGTNIENMFGTSSNYNQVGTGYIRYSKIDGNGTITNGNTNIANTTFEGATAFNSTGSSGTVNNSTFGYASISATNIPSLTMTQVDISSGSSVSANNATRLYLYRSSAKAGGRFLVSANASMDCSYCVADNYGYMQATQGTMIANYCNANSLGYLSHQSTGSNRYDRCNVSSQANMRFLETATGGRMYYCDARSGASIYQRGTSTNCYQYYCDASSLAQIYIQNSVNARHYYNSADSYSYIRAYGTNSGQSIMYYCKASARGYLDHLNISNRIRFYSVTVQSQSIARQTGGTADSNLYYSSFHAYYYFLGVMNGGTRSGLHGYGRQSYTGAGANGAGTRNWA